MRITFSPPPPPFFSSDYVVCFARCAVFCSCTDAWLDRIGTLSAGSVALPLSFLRSAGRSGRLSGSRTRFLRPFFLALPAARCCAPVIASLVSPRKFLSLCCCAYWVVGTFFLRFALLQLLRDARLLSRNRHATPRSSPLELLGGCCGILACVAIISLFFLCDLVEHCCVALDASRRGFAFAHLLHVACRLGRRVLR